MLNTQTNVPLSKLTTLAIGGPASEFVEVKTEGELIEAIGYAKQKNREYFVIGGGSNLLVADEGIEKLIIKNSIAGVVLSATKDLPKLEDSSALPQNDKVTLTVKSGNVLQDLVNFAIEHNLSGLQKLTGIPGTVGGAIYGNAGAYGQTISDYLVEITILNPSVIPANASTEQNSGEPESMQESPGSRIKYGMTKEECEFGYRDSKFKKNKFIILEAKFQLDPGDKQTLETETKNTLEQRLVKYPVGIKCPGSFFKNIVAATVPQEILAKIPPEKIVYGKIPAGALLEEVGARGAKQGDIEIASYHANLFINTGNGTAKDFYELAKQMSEKVKEKFGVTLDPEVQLINLPPF